MLVPVAPEAFAQHFDRFQPAVRRLFPILGYAPEAGERFIECNAGVYDDTVFTVELATGQTAYSRRCDGWDIVYLLPSHWPERYEIVRQALLAIRAAYWEARPAGPLIHRIDEAAPSHGAYYLGMLPDLGFELEPRARLTVSAADLETLPLPSLPGGLGEIEFTPSRLAEFVDCYCRAYSVYQERWPAAKQVRFREGTERGLRESATQEDQVQSWVGIEDSGTIVGSCFGSCFRERLFIEELALLPAYTGRGLGRFLLLRCLQRLRAQFGQRGSTVVLDCYRTYERALRLYRALGFQVSQWYTNATFWPVAGAVGGSPPALTASARSSATSAQVREAARHPNCKRGPAAGGVERAYGAMTPEYWGGDRCLRLT